MMRRLTLALVVGLSVPAAASGQSLLNAAGLGLPVEALDARTRAMGGVGIGLQGPALLPTDPAASVGYILPSVQITAQPSWVDAGTTGLAQSGKYRGTRFPSLGIAYPVLGYGVATLSFESVFDQRYKATQPVTVDLGEGPVQVTDDFVSDGGVSTLRMGFSRIVGRRLALGISGARYAGSLTRRLTRDFGTGTGGEPVEAYQIGGLWTYSGTAVTGGASLAVGTFAQLAGSFTWSSGLKANPSVDTEGDSRTFDMPLQLRVGGTAVLAPGLSLSAGYTTADWSNIDNDLGGGASVGTTNSFGVGLELSRARILGKRAPLRFGYRTRDLPFLLGQQGAATESVWAGGLGMHLAQSGEFIRSALDLALEHGTRKDNVLSESFWRATITVRVSGF